MVHFSRNWHKVSDFSRFLFYHHSSIVIVFVCVLYFPVLEPSLPEVTMCHNPLSLCCGV